MVNKENKIEKRNDLNEVRARRMTMQQLRFFAIYLSRINARDESTRRVRFPLSDFQKIMGLGRLNVASLKAATDGLLCQIVHIPNENGGFRSFQLFKECNIDKDAAGVWYVEIDAHDKALPLFFDFKEKYFIYDVGNVLRLSSANQMRMYEILKQRQNMTQPVIIQLPVLRELLGIAPGAYAEYKNFKRRVIDAAQIELAAQTDITFSFEPVRSGHKVAALAFTISANKANFPQMSIAEWLNTQPAAGEDPRAIAPGASNSDIEPPPAEYDAGPVVLQPLAAAPEAGADLSGPQFEAVPMPEDLELYAEALPEGMTPGEVDALQMLARPHIEAENRFEADLRIYEYLQGKTKLMNAQRRKVKPENRFSWLKKAIAEDWK